LGRRAPAVALPAMDPARDAVADIFAVRIEVRRDARFQGFEGGNGRHQLHAVVGGQRLAALEFLAVTVPDQDGTPAAGARIPGAGAVRVDFDLFRFPAHGLRSRPYSPGEVTSWWKRRRRT